MKPSKTQCLPSLTRWKRSRSRSKRWKLVFWIRERNGIRLSLFIITFIYRYTFKKMPSQIFPTSPRVPSSPPPYRERMDGRESEKKKLEWMKDFFFWLLKSLSVASLLQQKDSDFSWNVQPSTLDVGQSISDIFIGRYFFFVGVEPPLHNPVWTRSNYVKPVNDGLILAESAISRVGRVENQFQNSVKPIKTRYNLVKPSKTTSNPVKPRIVQWNPVKPRKT